LGDDEAEVVSTAEEEEDDDDDDDDDDGNGAELPPCPITEAALADLRLLAPP
jgi:hypothetical protein